MVLNTRCQLLGQLFLPAHILYLFSEVSPKFLFVFCLEFAVILVSLRLIGTFLIRCFGGNLWASSGGWDLRHMFFLLAALMCLLRLAQPLPGSPNCWDKASLSLGCLSRQDQMFSSWKQSWEAISSSLLQQDRILHPSLPGWGGEDL